MYFYLFISLSSLYSSLLCCSHGPHLYVHIFFFPFYHLLSLCFLLTSSLPNTSFFFYSSPQPLCIHLLSCPSRLFQIFSHSFLSPCSSSSLSPSLYLAIFLSTSSSPHLLLVFISVSMPRPVLPHLLSFLPIIFLFLFFSISFPFLPCHLSLYLLLTSSLSVHLCKHVPSRYSLIFSPSFLPIIIFLSLFFLILLSSLFATVYFTQNKIDQSEVFSWVLNYSP